MKFGRAKTARRTLAFFARTVGLKAPYHVILDGNFIVAFIKYRLPLKDRLNTTLLKTPVVVYVTQSTVDELKRLYTSTKNPIINETLEWIRQNQCQILEENGDTHNNEQGKVSSTPAQDIYDHLCGVNEGRHNESDRKRPYILCSQDEELLDRARQLGTCPVLRLVRNSVLILEQPSKSATVQAQRVERSKLSAWSKAEEAFTGKPKAASKIAAQEQALAEEILQKERNLKSEAGSTPIQHQRRKRKAKGPNPLSCKKKKT